MYRLIDTTRPYMLFDYKYNMLYLVYPDKIIEYINLGPCYIKQDWSPSCFTDGKLGGAKELIRENTIEFMGYI